MATLKIQVPGSGTKVYHIYKKLTSLGRSDECDVVLPDPLLSESHAHIHFDGRDFNIALLDRDAEVFVNGRKRKKHRLAQDDRVRLGTIEMEFSLFDQPVTDETAAKTMAELDSYKKLFDFSQQLMRNYEVGSLLESLLDVVVQVSNADKGFIVLMESGEPVVKVARNLRRETIADAIRHVSDSILAQVLEKRKAIIVSDALHDDTFSTAVSVVNLKLTSVMCVPMLERGDLIGVIYVGNDSVAQLFDESHLEILTIFASQASLIIRNALLVNELTLDKRSLLDQIERMRFGEIVGAAPAMQDVFRKIQKVAGTDISVLVTGETGTGKELIARELHVRSSRAKGPFITINCGAIPENLLESELFGYVKGAFTGAVANKMGRFQAANKGTLFLDEIGEMPIQLQVKILRALQERVVVRVGDNTVEPVDIRVIAATNRKLEQEIKAGRFREDLYYRLNVVNLHLPPLRDRGEDIVVLARYLLSRHAAELQSKVKGFSPSALSAMKRHAWPGNIREMENRIKKAVVLSDKAMLGAEDMGLGSGDLPTILSLADAKEKFQRDYINEILALNSGNRTQTARDLDVDPRTVFRHLEKDDSSDGGIAGTDS
ncbi:MAG: sigma 54-interacting transcriptional regulator [Deltaproteobacteria bacterium]|nr:sigma 54-interacting transcriptional regulator [Deltaproteobacteria bacterium]